MSANKETLKITNKLKDKIWKDYTKKTTSKNELKQMFLGANPTSAYQKISVKLKKKINDETSRRSPKRSTKSPKRSTRSPKRSTKSTRSPKRSTRSPKRSTRSTRSPKRSTRSPKRSTRSPKRSKNPFKNKSSISPRLIKH